MNDIHLRTIFFLSWLDSNIQTNLFILTNNFKLILVTIEFEMLNEKLKILSTVDFLKSLRSIYREWKYKGPFRQWCYFYSIGRIGFKMIGIPLFQEDLRVFWYSYCTFLIFGLYVMAALYTAVYYIQRGEPEKFIPCTCLLSTMISVSFDSITIFVFVL